MSGWMEEKELKFDRNMLLLYAVTDRAWEGRQNLYGQVETALKSGITLLQLREKNLSDREFIEEAKQMKELARSYQVPLIINDHVQAAAEIDADGVHVGQGDMSALDVRRLIGPDKILGVTAKTVEQAVLAQEQGADYLGAGAVFGSSTKTDAETMDMETLAAICQAVTIPVVAIGGIQSSNIMQMKGSGVSGAAVVSAIFGAEDISSAVKKLLIKSKEMVGVKDE